MTPATFSADIIACGRLPPPITCDASKELTKSANLAINDAIDLNEKYVVTFYNVFTNPTTPVFRLNDLKNIRQNFMGFESETTIDFAVSDTVLVLSTSKLTYDSNI